MRKRSLLSAIAVYLLLIAGALLFSFPFVWLVSTSVKVDRELFSGGFHITPIKPVPRLKSPYVDDRYYPEPQGARAERMMGEITELVNRSRFRPPRDVDPAAARRAIARGLYRRLSARLPHEAWTGPIPQFAAAAAREVNEQAISEVFDTVYRHFDLGQLVVRSQGLVEQDLGAGLEAQERFDNLTPEVARLTSRRDRGQTFATVNYNFGRGGKAVLSKTLRLKFPANELQRVQLYIRPDDTWHELMLTVERNGKVYRAERPALLANFEAQSLTWQEPGADDQSLRIKTWLLLHPVKRATSAVTDPRQLKLTLELRRVGQARAWWNKLRYNYLRVTDEIPFWRYVRVSVFLVVMNILLAVVVSSLVAYGFARLTWPGRDLAFILMLATLMIPGQVTMIPHFLIWRNLGAYDTLTPLWLGAAFGNAFFIFLLRQTLRGIPRDLEDAARIDGCGFLRIYWHIMLPLIKPSLAAIAIFTFMGTWNDFMGPLIYLSDQRLYPLAFGLYAYSVQVSSTDFTITMAASLLMTLPVIAFFFFAQKYFIRGITLTGMKG